MDLLIYTFLILAALCVPVLVLYNNLVTLRQRYRNAYSQIDVQLKRRYDLIPNLVEVAKGYMQHERQTLEALVKARALAVTAGARAAADPGQGAVMLGLMQAEATLSGALGSLFGLVESYPDLKANANMLKLMEELSTTENRIAFARQAYNDAVMFYNISCEKFPNSMVAGTFGFVSAAFFEIKDTAERKAVSVKV